MLRLMLSLYSLAAGAFARDRLYQLPECCLAGAGGSVVLLNVERSDRRRSFFKIRLNNRQPICQRSGILEHLFHYFCTPSASSNAFRTSSRTFLIFSISPSRYSLACSSPTLSGSGLNLRIQTIIPSLAESSRKIMPSISCFFSSAIPGVLASFSLSCPLSL